MSGRFRRPITGIPGPKGVVVRLGRAFRRRLETPRRRAGRRAGRRVGAAVRPRYPEGPCRVASPRTSMRQCAEAPPVVIVIRRPERVKRAGVRGSNRRSGARPAAPTGAGRPSGRGYEFFREKMTNSVAPEWKDPKRTADAAMRDTVFRQQKGKCTECGERLRPGQIELHHIEPHLQGGTTTPSNLAAVHPHCHPKSKKEVRESRERARV